MTALLTAIAPVSLIIVIGFVVGRTLDLDGKTLSQLIIYILFPALIASSLYRTTLSAQSTVGLVAGFAIASLVLYLIVLGLGKIFNLTPNTQKSLVATTLFANTGNLGLPLITFTLGEAGLERAVVYLIAASILIVGVGPALLKGDGIKAGMQLTFKLPMFWAMLGGIFLRLFAIKLPLRLDEGIALLGSAAIPIALIMLGMQLAQTRFEFGRYEIGAAGLRLLVAPLVACGIGHLLRLEGLDLQVLVMQGAMPTAVNTIVWVSQFGGDTPRVARTILVSTLMSFLTLPMMLRISSLWL
ncbi:MAG: AEC family transporter [Cyanothece sp. SIO1E1]|nr:AEC family transporter [Cyanothece sp. SIO1E1]